VRWRERNSERRGGGKMGAVMWRRRSAWFVLRESCEQIRKKEETALEGGACTCDAQFRSIVVMVTRV
jgi:hypothetical protein